MKLGEAVALVAEVAHAERADAIRLVDEEATRATAAFGDFRSMHEAWGVLREEYQELEAAFRLRQAELSRPLRIREEAVQVAAVCLRIIEQADRVTR